MYMLIEICIVVFKIWKDIFLQNNLNFESLKFIIYVINSACNDQFSDNFSLIVQLHTTTK